MDCEWLGIDAVQAAFGRLDRKAVRHVLEQMMAPVLRQYHSLTTFGYQRSGFAFKREMADHFSFTSARHHRDDFTALDFDPVAIGREDLRVNVVVAVDLLEATGDCRRIAFLRELNAIVAHGHEGEAGSEGASGADGRISAFPVMMQTNPNHTCGNLSADRGRSAAVNLPAYLEI